MVGSIVTSGFERERKSLDLTGDGAAALSAALAALASRSSCHSAAWLG